MTELTQLIGQRFRRARLNSFLSLRELAEKSCVPFTTIHHIEQGHDGRLTSVIALAGALGLSLDRLAAPSSCTVCDGTPPTGFNCQTCGTEGPAVTT